MRCDAAVKLPENRRTTLRTPAAVTQLNRYLRRIGNMNALTISLSGRRFELAYGDGIHVRNKVAGADRQSPAIARARRNAGRNRSLRRSAFALGAAVADHGMIGAAAIDERCIDVTLSRHGGGVRERVRSGEPSAFTRDAVEIKRFRFASMARLIRR